MAKFGSQYGYDWYSYSHVVTLQCALKHCADRDCIIRSSYGKRCQTTAPVHCLNMHDFWLRDFLERSPTLLGTQTRSRTDQTSFEITFSFTKLFLIHCHENSLNSEGNLKTDAFKSLHTLTDLCNQSGISKLSQVGR